MIEAKSAQGGVPQLAETLCAFGNMPAGGAILLGVDENSGFALTGVSDIALVEAGVAAQARSAVIPPVHTDFEVVDVAGSQVLVVTVAGLPLADKPCRTGGKAYLRQADGDYVMSPQEVAQLVAMQDRPRYDALVIENSSLTDLDADLTAGFLFEARSSSRRLSERSDSDVLRLKGVSADGKLTVAGLYSLGSYPQQYAPSLSLTAAVAPLRPGERMGDLAHLDGPIPDLVEHTVEWVRRNTRNAVVFDDDGNGIDVPEIPLVAVREFVANALIHRDLSPRTQSKRVEVRLLPDRLVISSPGGLWGVSRDQLGEPGGKSAVNEFLYDIGRLIRTATSHRVVEGEGGGIREAIEALRRAGLPDPVFVDTGVTFTVLIYRDNARTSVGVKSAIDKSLAHSPNAATVLATLGDQAISVTELMERSGLTRRQVKYALDKLVMEGLVALNGGKGNRFTTYFRA